jgi:hypothetical protein
MTFQMPFLRIRLAQLVMLGAVAGLVAAGLAYAATPSDLGPYPLSTVPDCTAAANIGGARICKVRVVAGGNWRASAGEWIVIRAAVGHSGAKAKATCMANQAAAVVTITIDGQQDPVDTIPCALDSGRYEVDWRALSHPLKPGRHIIAETWYFPRATPDWPKGATAVWLAALTVAPKAQ